MEIINHEYYVSLEVAKLLKEAGFDWETNNYYEVNKYNGESVLRRGYNNSNTNWNAKHFFMRDIDRSIFVNNGTYIDSITGDYITSTFFSAPTLDVVQRWLREVKEYHIILNHRTEMFFEERRYNLNEIKADIVNKYPGGGIYITSTAFYPTYEEVQEAGEKKALELILEKGE